MVKDINPGAAGSELQEFINVNGVLYFRASDGVHGTELWKSNGTPGGTVMIKDINPGPNGSFSSTLFAMNGVVYFQATDGTHGTELWKSDGTEVGTIMLKDIYPGVIASGLGAGTPNSGNPGNFTSVNGVVYFAASDGNDAHEVWKTDGTVAGTALVKDIYAGIPGYALNNFISLNGTLFFTVYGGNAGNELWKSDGTPGGTTLVKAMPGGNFSNHSTVLNGNLYFLEGDGLWKSDGSTSGTILLKEKRGSLTASPELMMAVNGLLYFTGNDDANGLELWKSDGTAGGTALLKDIHAGPESSELNAFAKVGNKLFFSANDGIHGNEIWLSDGTPGGTRIVQDIEPGSGSAMESQMYELKTNILEVNGKIFASAFTTDLGNEIWVADAPADAPLPLTLLEFRGSLVNTDGYLQWITEHEENTVTFFVERSTDANNFIVVGAVPAANAAGMHHYHFTDPAITSLGSGFIYYRLRQTDIDGKYTYSNIVAIPIDNRKITVRLFPNPATNRINLVITSYQQQKLQWRLLDNTGRTIRFGHYDIAPGMTAISEDISSSATGVYFMQVISGTDLLQVIRLVKQ